MDLKLRAWDTKGGHMLDWFTITQTAWNKGEYLALAWRVLTKNDHTDTLLPMLFTGNVDKNKKEIYAGDYMKILLPDEHFWRGQPREKIGIVKYESDYGAFIVEWAHSKNQHHVILNCDVAFEGEVLGNVHENFGITLS